MDKRENLIPGKHILTVEEQSKGGKKSGEKRREKADIRKKLTDLMSDPAAPDVAEKLNKITGVPVKDFSDVVLASIVRGVMKSSPQMIEMLMEYTGQSKHAEQRDAELKIARERLEIEKQKADLEVEKQKLWMDAVKHAGEDETEDDGFIEALTGTVKDDWSDET